MVHASLLHQSLLNMLSKLANGFARLSEQRHACPFAPTMVNSRSVPNGLRAFPRLVRSRGAFGEAILPHLGQHQLVVGTRLFFLSRSYVSKTTQVHMSKKNDDSSPFSLIQRRALSYASRPPYDV